MSNRSTSAAWVKGFCVLFRDQGLDVPALLRDAGLDMAELEHPNTRCPTEQVSRLWELAVQRSRNATLGIVAPRTSSLASFDVVGYAMMSCANLRASLECLVRYLRVVSEAATMVLRDEQDGCAIELALFGGDLVPRQRCEFDLLTLLSFLRWISGRRIVPLFVDFTYPEPAHPQRYRNAFESRVRFNAGANRLLLAASDLALPLPTCNPVLEELHAQFASQCLTRLDDKKISRMTAELIATKLVGWEPRREQIARLLCMGERTLRRRLEEEGTSFQKILDDKRRELAQQYLSQQRYAVGEIAYMLGFADQGTLFRACRRWFNVSPKQYQARARTASLPAPPGPQLAGGAG